MTTRVTLKDLALRLDVSTTTISKALKGDKKISEETRNLVNKCAEEMGYIPNNIAKAMAYKGASIGVVFIKHPLEYSMQIEYGCYQALNDFSDYNISIIPKYVSEILAEDEINSALLDLLACDVDGIILFGASNHSFMYDNALDEIARRNIPLIIATGKKSSNSSIGQINMDAEIAGKMAAQFLSLSLPQKAPVALLSGVNEVSHTDISSTAFMSAIHDYGLSFLGVHPTNDDEHIAYYITEKILKTRPELKGIYVNHFNSISVCQCLEDHNRTDIIVISHDLYPALAEKIECGSLTATIFSNPCEIGKKSIAHMVDAILNNNYSRPYFKDTISPVLILKSNLPCYKEYIECFREYVSHELT